MMLKILLNNFIRDIAATPRAIADCPEVSSPIALRQVKILLLQYGRGTTFQAFDQLRECYFRRIFDMHMNMILLTTPVRIRTSSAVANLHQQLTTSHFYIALQNVRAIFCCPHQMRC